MNLLNGIWEGDFRVTGNMIVDGTFTTPTLNIFDNIKIIKSLSDLPTAVSGNITLNANTVYLFDINTTLIFTDTLTLQNNTMLYGLNKTLTLLEYTGVSNFINYTNANVTLRDIAIKTPNGTVFNVINTSSYSTYLEQVNFNTCDSLGTIAGGGLFARYNLLVNCDNGFKLSSTLGSVIFDTCSFRSLLGASNSSSIEVLSGATCSSFRIFNSIFDVASTHNGLKVYTGFTPTSNALLKNNIFTGLGNRLVGVNGNSTGWNIKYGENQGIAGLQFVDIEISTADTTLGNASGTYVDGSSAKGFTLDLANYDEYATVMEAKISALFTTTIPIQVGVRNHTDGINIGGLSASTSGTNVVIESSYVAITPEKEYTGYYVKPSNGSGTTRKSIKLTLKIY